MNPSRAAGQKYSPRVCDFTAECSQVIIHTELSLVFGEVSAICQRTRQESPTSRTVLVCRAEGVLALPRGSERCRAGAELYQTRAAYSKAFGAEYK